MAKSTRNTLLAVLLLLMLLTPAVAKTRKRAHPPKPQVDPPETVAYKYCMLDLGGARLSPHASGADQIHSLELFTAAPPSDGVTVTRDCRVTGSQVKGTVANVTVEYRALGVLDADNALAERVRTETVTFVLQKLAAGWHVARPNTAVHASPMVLAVRVEDALQTENDPAKRAALHDTLRRLGTWRDEDKIVRVARPETAPAEPASTAASKASEPPAAAPAGPAVDEEEPEPQLEPSTDPQAQPHADPQTPH